MMIWNDVMKYLLLSISLTSIASCDYFRKQKCEWYLMVDMPQKDSVDPGMVPLCLRNFEIKKQKCYLQSSVKLAEEVNGKKIRASDIVMGDNRTIIEAPVCQ